jgi:antitoxin Phd
MVSSYFMPKNKDQKGERQEAKTHAYEFICLARSEGPQLITRRDKEAVVMISDEQYERLVGKARQPKNLVQFFRDSPLVGIELDLERDQDDGRDIEHDRLPARYELHFRAGHLAPTYTVGRLSSGSYRCHFWFPADGTLPLGKQRSVCVTGSLVGF